MESLPRTERAQNSKSEKTEKKKAAEESDEAPAAKKASKKKAKPAADEGETDKDSKVFISPKAKSMSTEEREMSSAENLMDHVNSGKLGPEEKELAMKRVDDILKKYGKGRA